jgi:hypothetical protein
MPGWLTDGITLLTPATWQGGMAPQFSVDTLLPSGQSPQTAALPISAISSLGAPTAGVTATGTTQLGAKAITAFYTNIVQASTASTKGVRLPAAATGLSITLANTGAFGVKCYPSTNGKIGSAATNAAYGTTLAVGKVQVFRAINKTQWVASF